MIRFPVSSALVLALAVGSSLSAAWWLSHLSGKGEAQAAVIGPVPASGAVAQVLKGADGHYWTEALIEGRVVRVMVDTGASVIVLTPDDAARIGLKLEPEDFGATVLTAAGPVDAAPVSLASVSVDAARVEHVDALVVETGLPHSLLGMSYLGRLSGFEATPESLTLRP
ncbi:TIGR02281 family clan AA aspartic protease [Rhizobium sp. CRIBSB]|nr:TIGR02281 family clan AA aspartic protease [Rhizobium sp. CRIBSB]